MNPPAHLNGTLPASVQSLPAPTVTTGASGLTPMTALLLKQKIGYDGVITRRLLWWLDPRPAG